MKKLLRLAKVTFIFPLLLGLLAAAMIAVAVEGSGDDEPTQEPTMEVCH